MFYRDINNMNQHLVRLAPRLPRDLDLIVGIPRSGLLAANILALHLNLPVTDVAGLAERRLISAGARGRKLISQWESGKQAKVLVIDDTLNTGRQLAEVQQTVQEQVTNVTPLYAAVYVAPGKEECLDYYCESLPNPRCFEWNIMHHPHMKRWCLDIDGVLCVDPLKAENDDGERYQNFLKTATPLALPTYKIGWLVTARLEKYRTMTEDWLHQQGVEFGHLMMMDYPNAQARRAAKQYGEFKASCYLASNAELFIESEPAQAAKIARISLKPVFCFTTRSMIFPCGKEQPSWTAKARMGVKKIVRRLAKRVK